MKKTMLFSLFGVFAISFPLYSQTANSTTGGRYVIICNTSGQFSETHILDSQTGRVWIERGQATQKPYFIPCTYQLLNGRPSLVPFDADQELALARSASTNSMEIDQAPVSELQKLKTDLFYADAEAQFWQQQLANIRAGKLWTAHRSWDGQGKTILGEPQSPSDSAAETVQSRINLCLQVKDQKQKQIQQLTNKTP